jgi:hypothetical protein
MAGVICTTSALGAGPTKAQCADADTQAQTLLQDHKLIEARNALRTCAATGCPSVVQKDCVERLDSLEHDVPTIVFDVKDGDGRDLSDVKITIDGAAFTDKLDGSPIEIDPGPHDVSFEVSGQPPMKRNILVHEGDKARHEAIVIGAPTAKPVEPTAPAIPLPPSTPPRVINVQKVAGASLTVVGVLGVALGGFLGLSASSQWSSASCSLPISCGDATTAQTKHDDASSNATASTIFFIAGGALAAGGVVLYLTAPKSEAPQQTTARVSISPSVAPGGGGLFLKGGF